jgi:cell fate (sporulation/competence/biofilm development) regulator YmcA (YheA/YmcA/DUF963 family)
MSRIADVKPLSEAISTPITQAYKAGGLGLTFLTLGAMLMLIAFFSKSREALTYVIFGVGTVLIFATLAFFYFKDMRKLVRAQSSVEKNKELIDTIQRTAIEMTELAYTLQALTFKHADQVSNAIQFIRPQLKSLPIVGKYADSEAVVRTEVLSTNIVHTTLKVKAVIEDLEAALIKSDPKNLKKYLDQLHEYKADVQKLLERGK